MIHVGHLWPVKCLSYRCVRVPAQDPIQMDRGGRDRLQRRITPVCVPLKTHDSTRHTAHRSTQNIRIDQVDLPQHDDGGSQ